MIPLTYFPKKRAYAIGKMHRPSLCRHDWDGSVFGGTNMKNILKRSAIVSGLMACCIILSVNPAASASDPAHDALVRFADRILANQLTDGAIVMGDPSFPPFQVVPYFSNLAAHGLMRAYEITYDPRYLNAAQAWSVWYLQHRNTDGTIYDFTGTVGHWTPTYDYDSTDSYASTFLEVAQKVLLYTPAGHPVAQALTRAVPELLDAQQLTMQPDGLTLAKPGYDFAFLEDNVEVYRGMVAAAEIPSWDRTGMPDPAWQAENTRYAIETLLFRTRTPAHYVIGMASDGTVEDISNWKRWYPEQQTQLMAIAWLPANADRINLYSYMKGRFYRSLPGRITDETQFDQIVWWAMSAQNIGDTTAAQQLVDRLTAYKPAAASYNVGLNGHACRILADSIRK